MIGLLPNARSKDLNQTCQKVLRLLADSGGWKIGKTKVHWNLQLRPPLFRPVFQNTKSSQIKTLELFFNVNTFFCSIKLHDFYHISENSPLFVVVDTL